MLSTVRRGSLERSFPSTVRPNVHTNPSRKQNFSKTLFKPKKFEYAGSVDGKHLIRFQSKTSVFKFLQRSVDGKHLMRFQSKTSVFKFLQRSVDGKHLMRFQSKTFVFKFLQRSVDGKHLMCFQSETSVFKFLQRSVDGKHLMRFQSETSVFKFLCRSIGTALVNSAVEDLKRCLPVGRVNPF